MLVNNTYLLKVINTAAIPILYARYLQEVELGRFMSDAEWDKHCQLLDIAGLTELSPMRTTIKIKDENTSQYQIFRKIKEKLPDIINSGISDTILVNEASALMISMTDTVERLNSEKNDLIALLVEITHRDGALEEQKSKWLPIVKRELLSRHKYHDTH